MTLTFSSNYPRVGRKLAELAEGLELEGMRGERERSNRDLNFGVSFVREREGRLSS